LLQGHGGHDGGTEHPMKTWWHRSGLQFQVECKVVRWGSGESLAQFYTGVNDSNALGHCFAPLEVSLWIVSPPTIGSSRWKPWSFLWSGNGGVIDVVSSMEALPWSSLHNTSWDWRKVQWRWLALGDGEDLDSVLRFTRVANRHKR